MPPHYAAGILPITWHEGNVLFLVGKDIRNGYSDFGGKCERVDRGNPVHTAVREFYEESYGVVCTPKSLLQKMASPANYMMLKSSTQNGYEYYMYVVEIPYQPHLRSSFRKMYKFLQVTNIQRSVYLEKTDIQYVTLDMLHHMEKRPVFHNTLELHRHTMAALAQSTPETWRSTLTQ